MAETKTPALSLSSTEFDRPVIEIDGESYEMRASDELSAPMMRRMIEIGKRIEGAQEVPDAESRVDAMAESIMQAVDTVMVDLPAEVRDRLTIRQHSRIVETFTKLASDEKPASSTG